MNRKIIAGSAWLWAALLLATALVPLPAAADTAYIYRQGTLKDINVYISTAPQDIYVDDNVTISYNHPTPGSTNVSLDYILFAGWGHNILNGSGVGIPVFGSHAFTVDWIPTSAGNTVVGINATDHDGGGGAGFLCALINVTVLERPANPLAAVISIDPADVRVGTNVTVQGMLMNTGASTLYDIHYVVFVGLGNYIGSGSGIELPGGANHSFVAHWVPAAAGNYVVGINASDGNGTASVVALLNVTVTAGGPGYSLAAFIDTDPDPIYTGTNVTVRVNLTNTGDYADSYIAYVIYAGWGNYIQSSMLWNLSAHEVRTLTAYWTPAAPGTYQIGINASVGNGTAELVAYINVTVLGGTPPTRVTLTVMPSSLSLQTGGTATVTARVSCSGAGGEFDLKTLNYPSHWYSNWSYSLSETHFNMSDGMNRSIMVQISLPAETSRENYPNGTSGGEYYPWLVLKDSATGNIVAQASIKIVITGGGISGGKLAATVAVSPDPAYPGTNATVAVVLSNTGNRTLYDIAYVIYAGKGNNIASGNIRELWPGAICQSVPYGIIDLKAYWTPALPGTYLVGITASDNNRTASVEAFINVTVKNLPVETGSVSIVLSKSKVQAQPGTVLNITATVTYNGPGARPLTLLAAPSPPDWFITVNGKDFVLTDKSSIAVSVSIAVPKSSKEGGYDLTLTVRDATKLLESSAVLTVAVASPPPVTVENAAFSVGAVAAASLAVVAVAVIGGTEIGIIALTALFLPLYVKLRKEEVLDQFTRGKIQGYITAYPGEHYSSIKAQLGLKNGALAYHLKVLEREGYITSVRDGVFKRFYPKEALLPRRRSQYSAIQEMILQHLKAQPGISQDRLAQMMKVSNQVVHYHVKNLLAAGAIRLERRGKETHCFLAGMWDAGS